MVRKAAAAQLLAKTRVPLPAKVLLSYLLVVLVGALPAYLYLRQRFLREFMTDSIKRVGGHAVLLANDLSDRGDVRARLDELAHLAPTFVERITYITASGRVLFDSSVADVRKLDNHSHRAEVERAAGRAGADPALDLDVPHTGVARRTDEVTQLETLYVAARVVDGASRGDDIVRLAVPMADLQGLGILLTRVFRNSQALAVSVAILLSMLAAILFMRPLQRLARVAAALAEGDYTVQVGRLGHDEVGDVGRALDKLAQELRRRLAVAQAGEAMLVQVVAGMHVPVAVFADEGRVVAINGAAKSTFSRRASGVEASLQRFLQSETFAAARTQALGLGEPVHVDHAVKDREGGVSGWVHVLKHPGGPPYAAFYGEEAVLRPQTRLPRPSELRALALAECFAAAREHAAPMIESLGLELLVDGAIPEVRVGDAHRRVPLAIVTALCGLAARQGTQVPLVFVDKATRVGLVMGAPVSDAAVSTASFLLGPLGGRIHSTAGRCVLFLAKA